MEAAQPDHRHNEPNPGPRTGAAAKLTKLPGNLPEPQLVAALLETGGCVGMVDMERVLAAANLALAGEPRRFELYYFAARGAFLAGHQRRAERMLQAALRVNKDRPEIWLLLARVYRSTGRPAQALNAVQQAQNCGDSSAELHALRGELYAALGQPLLARQAFQEALRRNAGLRAAQTGLAALSAGNTRSGEKR